MVQLYAVFPLSLTSFLHEFLRTPWYRQPPTMTNLLAVPPDDGRPATAHQPAEDDSSEATKTDNRSSKKKEEKMIEKTVKFRFLRAKDRQNVDPATFHLHWIQHVQEEFGDNVQVFNNNGTMMPKIDMLRWNSTQHAKYFKAYSPNADRQDKRGGNNNKQGEGGTTTIIIHRVRTIMTMTAMKEPQRIRNLLYDNNVFLTEHRWTEDIWDVTQLGFILGMNPQVHDPIQAKAELVNELRKRLPNHTKIPKFAVVFSSPKVQRRNSWLKTKAYSIEVERQNSLEMQKLLKIAYKDSHEFVPFQMKTKYPDAYANRLLQQTKLISETKIIYLNNIGSEAMFYLTELIKAVQGVQTLVPAKTVNEDGAYRVSCHLDNYHSVRSTLLTNLERW